MSPRTCIGSFAVVTALVSLQARPAGATLLQVPEGFGTIAAALAAAGYGDTVSLAPGTYFEHDLVVSPGASLIGRSTDPAACVIDAQQQGRVLGGDNLTSSNRIERITFQNGYTYSGYGAGLRLAGSPLLVNVTVAGCSSEYCDGVGMYCSGSPEINDSRFMGNHGLTESTRGGGLAISSAPGQGAALDGVVLEGNSAGWGGGLYYWYSSGDLSGLTLRDNSAIVSGGGAYFMNMGSDGVGPNVERSVFAGNHSAHTGGGVGARGSVILSNCTLVLNTAEYAYGAGGGFYSGSNWDVQDHPQLQCCIVAGNKGGGVGLWDAPQVHLECCDVYGNAGGNYVGAQADWTGVYGNISMDPLFCDDTDSLTFDLQADSPCAPADNGCAVLMGAFPVNCAGTGVSTRSWGSIKALY